MLGAVLLSGCAGNKQPLSPEENTTVVETPQENVTAVETGASEENVTSEENETAGVTEVSTSGIQKAPSYLVKLENYKASASSFEIKKGEAVAWINKQKDPKIVFTLVSEENLFENKKLGYRHTFTYTFNETGEYNFSVVSYPRMNISVNVV